MEICNLQHKIFFLQKYSLTYFIARAHTHARTHTRMHARTHAAHTHTHTKTGTRVACTRRYRHVNRKWGVVWGVGKRLAAGTMTFRSLVHGLRGIMWFWLGFFLVCFWTGILLQHSVQSMGVYSMWFALGIFSFVLESKKSAGVSRGTQWMGWDVQVKQVRQVRRGSFWDSIIAHTWKRLYIQFFELLEANAA